MVYLAATVYEVSHVDGSYRLASRVEGNPNTSEDDIVRGFNFVDYTSAALFLRKLVKKGDTLTYTNLPPAEREGLQKIIADCENQKDVLCEL